MKKQVVLQIIAIFLIAVNVLLPYFIYAEEGAVIEEVAPTPQEIEDITPSPVAENQPVTDQVASAEAELTVTDSNDITIENNVEGEANTGEAIVEEEAVSLATGEATAEASLENIANLNCIGSQFNSVILSQSEENNSPIDLSDVDIDSDPSSLEDINYLNIDISNWAKVQNNILLSAITGGNAVGGDNSFLLTGDATVNANLFNLVNTNLIGTSWFFTIINLFADQNGNIILPYEFDYLQRESVGGADNHSNNYIFNNNVSVVTNVQAESNTGGNIINADTKVSTGDSDITVNTIDTLNTNVVGNNWLLLKINHMEEWNGDLVGWWGSYYQTPQYTLAWANLNDSPIAVGSSHPESNIIITNEALINNNLDLISDTGSNEIKSSDSSVSTGMSSIKANIVNFVNTNIIGSYWYYATINVFGSLLGNVVLPRPDLSLFQGADKDQARPGQEVTFFFKYANNGNYKAQDTLVIDLLPPGTQFVSATHGGAYDNGKVVWNLTTVPKQLSDSFSLTVKVDEDIAGNEIINAAQILTKTYEQNLVDNTNVLSVSINRLSEEDDSNILLENEANQTLYPDYFDTHPVEDNNVFVMGDTQKKDKGRSTSQSGKASPAAAYYDITPVLLMIFVIALLVMLLKRKRRNKSGR
jgi:uncharacterized repeat protein (TIGR01451 family)